MSKEFDFESFKESESYTVPDGFFDKITAKSMKEAKRREKNTIVRRFAFYGGAVAAMLISVLMLVREPVVTEQEISAEMIVDMFSDSELQSVLMAMDSDIFYADLDNNNE